MADVLIDSGADSDSNEQKGLWGPFWTSPSIGYIFSQEGPISSDYECRKTTDSGASWTLTDEAGEPTSSLQITLAAWFDQQTPGDTGVLIHLAWLSSGTVFYAIFDTSDDTWGTHRTVDSLTISGGVDGQQDLSIVKAKSGRITIVARGNFAADTEDTDHSMRSSSDNFVSDNVSESSPYTSDEEMFKLQPGSATDEDDICGVVYDLVNRDLEFWKYDRSATTWTKTTIDATITITTAEAREHHGMYDCQIQHSDEAIIVCYWNDVDGSAADFECVHIDQATPTITQKTNIVTNSDDCALAALVINQQNDDWYIGYVGNEDGSEVFKANVHAFFKKSTDGGSIWGSQTTYSVADDDLRTLKSGPSIGNNGGRVMFAWFNDDTTEYLVNDGNDIEIAAGSVEINLTGSQPFSTGVISSLLIATNLLGAQPASSGGLTGLFTNRGLIGSWPSSSGILTAQQTLGINIIGDWPSSNGILTQQYQIALTGIQPSSSGVLSALQTLAINLTGSWPSSSGVLTPKQTLLRGLVGNWPNLSGILSQKYLISLLGDQPSFSGELTSVQILTVSLTGNQPSFSGVLSQKYLINLIGSQPASSGELTPVPRFLVGLLGNQPQSTGTLVALQTLFISLLGNQPQSTGLLALKSLISLLGNQPQSTGVLTPLQTLLIGLLGNQPTSNGVLTQQYLISLLGDLPTSTGILSNIISITLLGNQPESSGILIQEYQIVLIGSQPASSGAISAVQVLTIALQGSWPAFSGVLSIISIILLSYSITLDGISNASISINGIASESISIDGKSNASISLDGLASESISLDGKSNLSISLDTSIN